MNSELAERHELPRAERLRASPWEREVPAELQRGVLAELVESCELLNAECLHAQVRERGARVEFHEALAGLAQRCELLRAEPRKRDALAGEFLCAERLRVELWEQEARACKPPCGERLRCELRKREALADEFL